MSHVYSYHWILNIDNAGPGADLWSLGILIFEMFCGFTPFADEEDVDEDAIYERIIKEDLSVSIIYK